MKKSNIPSKVTAEDIINELEKRYPDSMPLVLRGEFEQGIDVGYQAIINEIKEMISEGID